MSKTAHYCPLCGDLLVEVEASINRTLTNMILTGFGSSELQIRLKDDGDWVPYMRPERSAEGLLCTKCGALTVAPTIPSHREELGLDPLPEQIFD